MTVNPALHFLRDCSSRRAWKGGGLVVWTVMGEPACRQPTNSLKNTIDLYERDNCNQISLKMRNTSTNSDKYYSSPLQLAPVPLQAMKAGVALTINEESLCPT